MFQYLVGNLSGYLRLFYEKYLRIGSKRLIFWLQGLSEKHNLKHKLVKFEQQEFRKLTKTFKDLT